jgi:uncharacterized protein YicC (UPF0701 family)
LLAEAKRQKAMNTAFTNFATKIAGASTNNSLGTINKNIAEANLNPVQKTNLRRKISIRQKILAGQSVRALRNAAAAAPKTNINLNRTILNRYVNFRGEINAAATPKEILRLQSVLNKKTGKMFTPQEMKNAQAALNNKRRRLGN